MSQKISSQWPSVDFHQVHGALRAQQYEFRGDHEPDAMPVIIAARSSGKAYEPTFHAPLNPAAEERRERNRAMEIATEVVRGV